MQRSVLTVGTIELDGENPAKVYGTMDFLDYEEAVAEVNKRIREIGSIAVTNGNVRTAGIVNMYWINSYEKNVRKGIDFLNNHFGTKNWHKMVDWVTLDMELPTKCVGGQMYGTYSRFADKVFGLSSTSGEHRKTLADYGFIVSSEDEESYDNWDILLKEWQRQVKQEFGVEVENV